MKFFLTIFLLIGGSENFTGNVSDFNKVKRAAEFAFNDEDYQKAAEKYTYLIDSLKYDDDNAKLNLAHSFYNMDEIDKAKNIYMGLSDSKNKEIKSIANQQLGVFESRGKNLQKSLDHFKKSLMANPKNEEARYNYELVKKKLEEEQKNQDQNQDNKQDQQDKQDQKKQDQDKKDQQDQQQNKDQQKDQDQKSEDEKKKEEEQKKQDKQEQKEQGQKDDPKEQDQKQAKPEEGEEKKPEEMKQQPQPGEPNFEEKEISKEMAEMILQAMRNKELQYLQQLKRKPQKPVDKDKPDW